MKCVMPKKFIQGVSFNSRLVISALISSQLPAHIFIYKAHFIFVLQSWQDLGTVLGNSFTTPQLKHWLIEGTKQFTFCLSILLEAVICGCPTQLANDSIFPLWTDTLWDQQSGHSFPLWEYEYYMVTWVFLGIQMNFIFFLVSSFLLVLIFHLPAYSFTYVWLGVSPLEPMALISLPRNGIRMLNFLAPSSLLSLAHIKVNCFYIIKVIW